MKFKARKLLKIAGYTVGSLLGVVALYLGGAFVLERIPVAKADPNAPAQVQVFLLSNGVHTDLVVPVRNEQMDWSQQVKYADTPAADPRMGYVGFGWGDKGFYLDTPTWADLKFSTAFKAAFYLGTSAMHATFHHTPQPGPDCVELHLSREEYARLVAYIQASFERDATGNVLPIRGHSYGQYDAFYEAHRTYSLFYTCNTWANNGLKAAGQKASLWTPFDSGMFYQYGK